jgi:Flp pilus assembly secretin CpaC
VVLLVVGAPVDSAQQPAAAPAATPPVQQSASSVQETGEPQTLHLLVGRSLVISSPTRIKRVSLADPEIAEALVVSPTQVLVNGRKPGGQSGRGRPEPGIQVSVDIDVLGLSQKITVFLRRMCT